VHLLQLQAAEVHRPAGAAAASPTDCDALFCLDLPRPLRLLCLALRASTSALLLRAAAAKAACVRVSTCTRVHCNCNTTCDYSDAVQGALCICSQTQAVLLICDYRVKSNGQQSNAIAFGIQMMHVTYILCSCTSLFSSQLSLFLLTVSLQHNKQQCSNKQ
jgi:hypothetical protein